jgi:hypothetical protein
VPATRDDHDLVAQVEQGVQEIGGRPTSTILALERFDEKVDH